MATARWYRPSRRPAGRQERDRIRAIGQCRTGRCIGARTTLLIGTGARTSYHPRRPEHGPGSETTPPATKSSVRRHRSQPDETAKENQRGTATYILTQEQLRHGKRGGNALIVR